MKYNTITFFGDSFTWGQDSGGDGIYDADNTYPTHVGKLLGLTVNNFAEPGESNPMMFAKLYSYLKKERPSKLNKTLILVNLSSHIRGMTSIPFDTESKFIWDGTETSLELRNVSTSFIPRSKMEHRLMDMFASEEEEFHLLNSLKMIYAAIGIAHVHRANLYFVDMLFNLNDLRYNFNADVRTLERYFVNPEHMLAGLGAAEPHMSVSKHYYGAGYLEIAKEVVSQLEAYDII